MNNAVQAIAEMQMMPIGIDSRITASKFFAIWLQVCESRKTALLLAWESCPRLTSEIFHVDPSVIRQVATLLNLSVYSNYYAIDAVFVDAKDRVHCAPITQNWFHNVQIAFEHENIFRSGLFQEVSHLLITRADLRVLVTYPENYDVEREFRDLATIISQSGLKDPAFLLITGKRNKEQSDIHWLAYTYDAIASRLLPI